MLSLGIALVQWVPRVPKKAKYLLDTGQNVRFAMLVAVSTNTKVDFAGVLVRFEGLGNTWQYVKQRWNSMETRYKGFRKQ